MSSRPARQVCPVCAFSDDVVTLKVDDEWVMTCSNEEHLPYEWRPTEAKTGPTSWRNGLGQELGVYDTLLECVTSEMVEYGVVEHRFALADPSTYRFLVKRYGHRALGPSKYTASQFLAGALGQLWREELVAGVWGPATGYWSYNGQISCYGAPEVSEDGPIMSWAEFATSVLGTDPNSWSALDRMS